MLTTIPIQRPYLRVVDPSSIGYVCITSLEAGADPARRLGESDAAYALRRVQYPWNNQLQNLVNAAAAAPSRCARAQFFGEFLHAYEDTFSHRTQTNVPIEINLGFGHLDWGEHPDYTYNHVVPFSVFPLAMGNWALNEARTLSMEQGVLQLMAGYSGRLFIHPVTGRQLINPDTGTALTQADLFGNGTAAGNGWMQQWNRMQNPDDKIFFIDEKLTALGLGGLPLYSRAQGADNRNRYLCGLPVTRFPGTILPSGCT